MVGLRSERSKPLHTKSLFGFVCHMSWPRLTLERHSCQVLNLLFSCLNFDHITSPLLLLQHQFPLLHHPLYQMHSSQYLCQISSTACATPSVVKCNSSVGETPKKMSSTLPLSNAKASDDTNNTYNKKSSVGKHWLDNSRSGSGSKSNAHKKS